MKKIFLLLVVLLLSGCSAASLLDVIPNTAFDEFSYDRSGNVTSAHITAKGATVKDGWVEIKEIKATGDYGPMFNYRIYIKGYKRQLKVAE